MLTALVVGSAPSVADEAAVPGGEPTVASADSTSAPASPAGDDPAPDPVVTLDEPVNGTAAIEELGDQIDEVAASNDMRTGQLKTLLRHDATAYVSTTGDVFFADPAESSTASTTSTSAGTTTALAPLDQTFDLHSKPGSKHSIYLNVHGANVGGTWWQTDFPALDTDIKGWDPAGDGVGVFSDSERTQLQQLWATVAEDFAPFDVDVTTADPGPAALYHENSADDEYGVQVLIGNNPQANSVLCSNTCSGIAWRGGEATNTFMPGDVGFGSSNSVFVFAYPGSAASSLAGVASHEVGHTVELQHDGDQFGAYAGGHGVWGAIMGGAAGAPVAQWSKGDYPTATNHENDLGMIAGHFGWRGDEAGTRFAQAAPMPTGKAYITTPDDQDTYLLGHCAGPIDLRATPADAPNLDVQLTLRNAAGEVVATDDPPSSMTGGYPSRLIGMDARIAQSVPDGFYYLTVDGVGNGDWTTGYDDYDSLGAYTLTGGQACDGAWPTGVTSLAQDVTAVRPEDNVANKVTLSWTAPADAGSSPITGYVVSDNRGGIHDLPADATSYTWTDLGYSTTYDFDVVAMNGNGPSRRSPVSFTTPRQFVAPTAPQGVTATYNPAPRTATMTWNAPADDGGKPVTGYDVYLSDTSTHSFNFVVNPPASETLVASVGPDVRSVDVSGIKQGAYNYLRVVATNVIGTGRSEMSRYVQPQAPQANDAFGNATSISGTNGASHGSTLLATGQDQDPTPTADRAGAGDSSVWFSWTAPANRVVTFSTATYADTTAIDTTLDVYTGSTLGALTRVAGNDDRSGSDTTSSVRFTPDAGTTYLIAVDGYRAAPTGVGSFALGWAMSGSVAISLRATPVTNSRVDLSSSVNPGSWAPGGFSPEGSVVFREDGVVVGTVPVVLQQAGLVLPSVAGGQHTYTAAFLPDDTASWTAATADPRTVTVLGAIDNPDFQVSADDTDVTLAATFGSSATGTVNFREGAEVVATTTIVDGAAVSTIDVSEGDHTYVADFVPDTDAFVPATSVTRSVRVVSPTTTTATTEVNPVTALVTVKVVIAGHAVTPTGWIQLRNAAGDRVDDDRQVIDGAATFFVGQVPGGDHAWTATYVPQTDGTPSPHTTSTDSTSFSVDPWVTRTLVSVVEPTASHPEGSVSALVQDTVSGGRLSGAAEFYDGDQKVATVELADGVATYAMPLVRPGTHTYSARFVPQDATAYAASTSTPATPFTVATGASTTFLSPESSDHAVTLTTTVRPTLGAPAGTVTLTRDGKTIASGPVSADGNVGTFVYTDEDLASGTYGYTATYTPTDPTVHTGSAWSQPQVVVNPTYTDTSLRVRTDPDVRTDRLVAQVAARDWSGLPNGTVTFHDNNLQIGDPVRVVDGVATLDVTGVATGDHRYWVGFMPTSFNSFMPSDSLKQGPALVNATMDRSPTATKVTVAADGQTVTLQAAVTSPYQVPEGEVVFTDGGDPLGTASLDGDGTATLVRHLTPGDHTFGAAYRETNSWAPVYADSLAEPVTTTLLVDPTPPPAASTTTALRAVVSGRTVTLTTTVSSAGGVPSGWVYVYDGGMALEPVELTGGTATQVVSRADAGQHGFMAYFAPTDPSAWEYSSSDTRTVTVAPTATSTTLKGTVSGSVVRLTATVAGGDALDRVGVVVFRDGSREVGRYLLDGSDSTATTQLVAIAGAHSYSAAFQPSTTNATGSSSSPLSLSVAKVASRTTISAPTKAKVKSRPSVRVTVTSGGRPAAGTVVLSVNGKKVALTLRSGTATYKLPKLKKGTTKLAALYAGDSSTIGSSAAAAIRVK